MEQTFALHHKTVYDSLYMREDHNMQESLKRLILLAKNGDGVAFENIYMMYYAPLYRYIMSRVKNKQEAEDMTQVVFLKIWSHIESWNETHTSPLSFFFTVARNTLIDHFRKNSRRKEIVSDEIVNDFLETNNYSDKESTSRELREVLLQAISKLSEEQQEVINLYYQEDLSYKEISEITKKREDAVRQIHRRAINKLRELYKY